MERSWKLEKRDPCGADGILKPDRSCPRFAFHGVCVFIQADLDGSIAALKETKAVSSDALAHLLAVAKDPLATLLDKRHGAGANQFVSF